MHIHQCCLHYIASDYISLSLIYLPHFFVPVFYFSAYSVFHFNMKTKGGDKSAVDSYLSLSHLLTLRLLMSYIYGAPSKARNANVVNIWTYVWQR